MDELSEIHNIQTDHRASQEHMLTLNTFGIFVGITLIILVIGIIARHKNK
jgi:hypothetical protein